MERNSKNSIDRNWVTQIACPLCKENHSILWPHVSFPPPTELMTFECPKHGSSVVFPNVTAVWAEITFAHMHIISDDPIVAERFFG